MGVDKIYPNFILIVRCLFFLQITEPLKIAILKNFHELNLCDVSLWYKTTIGDIQDDIMECFKYVVKNGYLVLN